MDLDGFDARATSLDGVRRVTMNGLARWQLRGRLVARELDPTHLVIRASFAERPRLLEDHPRAFSVPAHFAEHMMVVADLAAGDDDAIEDALWCAWTLQSRGEGADG